MAKKIFDLRWILTRCGDVYTSHGIDDWMWTKVWTKVKKWSEGERTYARMCRLEGSLLIHPDTHWTEIGRGRIRLYSVKNGETVCEI